MSLWERLRRRLRRRPDLFNLVIEPAYAIKASPRNPYFQALERLARDAGFLGACVSDADGALRPGTNNAIPTRHARLLLDVYPNPAAIEGRSVSDYAAHRQAQGVVSLSNHAGDSTRRVAKVTLDLDDGSELLLWFENGRAHVAGLALGGVPCFPPNANA